MSLFFPPVRWAARRWGPKSGQGPTPKQRAKGKFTTTVVAQASDGTKVSYWLVVVVVVVVVVVGMMGGIFHFFFFFLRSHQLVSLLFHCRRSQRSTAATRDVSWRRTSFCSRLFLRLNLSIPVPRLDQPLCLSLPRTDPTTLDADTETAKMVSEMGMLLATKADTLPGASRGGVLTPAAAFGAVAIDALNEVGVTFAIKSSL